MKSIAGAFPLGTDASWESHNRKHAHTHAHAQLQAQNIDIL